MSGTPTTWERWIDPDADVAYRRLDADGVAPDGAGGLRVAPAALTALADAAFGDIAFYLPAGHLDAIAAVAADAAASAGERLVAAALIRNAVVAAEGVLPVCQDTGTATVFGFKGEAVRTGADDARFLAEGIRRAWAEHALRSSQVAALDMFAEADTGDNLPAQIDLRAVPGAAYRFLFLAKGGGSANKASLVQASKAVLNEAALEALLAAEIDRLGVAACPPYHLAVVIGGTSAEANLAMLKLASTGYLDTLPERGSPEGIPFRDRGWEARVLRLARDSGWGAQFGGLHLAAEARVIRLPRHAGSCPISVGVSCVAHRQARAKITGEGVFLEELDRNPRRLLDRVAAVPGATDTIDLDRPADAIAEDLRRLGAGWLVRLDGDVILARDAAHARFRAALAEGRPLPDYLLRHPVYYAGPARTPEDHAIGSLGPTTAQRMDAYVPELMAQGASRIMLGKGPRAPAVVEACRQHVGAYLAIPGGAAALFAQENVVASEILDFEDLGMEAVRRVRLRGLPALVAIDPSGRTAWDRRNAGCPKAP